METESQWPHAGREQKIKNPATHLCKEIKTNVLRRERTDRCQFWRGTQHINNTKKEAGISLYNKPICCSFHVLLDLFHAILTKSADELAAQAYISLIIPFVLYKHVKQSSTPVLRSHVLPKECIHRLVCRSSVSIYSEWGHSHYHTCHRYCKIGLLLLFKPIPKCKTTVVNTDPRSVTMYQI